MTGVRHSLFLKNLKKYAELWTFLDHNRPVGSGEGQVGLKPPNNLENNGNTSQALIRCSVLYCLKNNCSPNQQLLPTALDHKNIHIASWYIKARGFLAFSASAL